MDRRAEYERGRAAKLGVRDRGRDGRGLRQPMGRARTHLRRFARHHHELERLLHRRFETTLRDGAGRHAPRDVCPPASKIRIAGRRDRSSDRDLHARPVFRTSSARVASSMPEASRQCWDTCSSLCRSSGSARVIPSSNDPIAFPPPSSWGTLALLATVFFICLYLPGSPSALIWPQEWLIVLLWALLGVAFFAVARGRVSEMGRDHQRKAILGDYADQL